MAASWVVVLSLFIGRDRKMKKLMSCVVLASVLVLAGCAGSGNGNDPAYDKGGKSKAIKVTQTKRGVQITSDERVLFDSGKAEIKADGVVYIQRVATILKTKTKANVEVAGHTDNVGGEALNQQLSVRRANAVREALVKQGVEAGRIKAQGYGMSQPVADNNTPQGRQANRRTEILVLGETEANISPEGGLADQLGAGLDKFLKDAGEFMKNAFGSGKSE